MSKLAYENEEDRRSARIISTLIFVSWGAYFFVIILTLLSNKDLFLICAIFVGCVLQLVPYFLVRRGHLYASSTLVVLNAICTLTFVATIGQGIRDLSLIAFPIIFIFAGLTLNRNLFRLCVVISILAVCWLSMGEIMGWFIPQPYMGVSATLASMVMNSVLFIVGAIAVDLLVTNMRNNLIQARKELGQRMQVENALRKSDERFNLIVDATRDGLWDWLLDSDESYFSPGYYHMLGYETGDFPMKSNAWTMLIHPEDRENAIRVNMECRDGLYDQFEIEYRMKTKTGEWRWILARGKSVSRNAEGQSVRMVGTHMDLTVRKQAENQLRYQSTHDVLTKIYNRTFFEEELTRLEHSQEFPISIVMADVDGLKTTNDTLGHAAGDQLLREATLVLTSIFRTEDILARIGGDEFSALLPGTDSNTVEQIVIRIKDKMIEHNRVFPDSPVHLSLGAATAEKDNLTSMFTLADQRMYADKALRKANMTSEANSQSSQGQE